MSLEGGGAVLFFNNLCYGTIQCYVHLVGFFFFFWMCNLFNLYYLLVLFHLLKVFVSIAFVSPFLSFFLYLVEIKDHLKANRAAALQPSFRNVREKLYGVTLSWPRTVTGEGREGSPRRGQSYDTHARSTWHKRNNKQTQSVRGTQGGYYNYSLEGSRNKVQRVVFSPLMEKLMRERRMGRVTSETVRWAPVML